MPVQKFIILLIPVDDYPDFNCFRFPIYPDRHLHNSTDVKRDLPFCLPDFGGQA